MPAVLRRDEATGQNYCHRIGISASIAGGAIVKVIAETLNIDETLIKFVVGLEAPSNLEIY